MSQQNMYIVCYDIISNKGRRKIEKILSHYGNRIQLSVFECIISVAEFKSMIQKVRSEFEKSYFSLNKDSVIAFVICENCKSKRIVVGKNLPEEARFVIV